MLFRHVKRDLLTRSVLFSGAREASELQRKLQQLQREHEATKRDLKDRDDKLTQLRAGKKDRTINIFFLMLKGNFQSRSLDHICLRELQDELRKMAFLFAFYVPVDMSPVTWRFLL